MIGKKHEIFNIKRTKKSTTNNSMPGENMNENMHKYNIIPDMRSYLEKKVTEIIKIGFDFGNNELDNRRIRCIKKLETKLGILGTHIKVEHPRILEKTEKDILKKSKLTKKNSIIKGIDTLRLLLNKEKDNQV